MRLARYEDGVRRSFGIITEGGIIDLADRLGVPDIDTMLAERLLDSAHEFADATPDVRVWRLLKPLIRPGKCFCASVNYPGRDQELAEEVRQDGRASLFQRTPDSFVGSDEAILRPPESTQFDYEGEIVLVIGRSGRRIPPALAMDYVAGYMIANDGSVRDWTRHGGLNAVQGKNFWRSGSLGPWLTTRASAGDGPFHITTRVNGEVRQDGSTENMLVPMDELIAMVSTFTPLEAGDIILTGTPAGTGQASNPPRWLEPGDIVEVEASGLGVLRNTVADETEPRG